MLTIIFGICAIISLAYALYANTFRVKFNDLEKENERLHRQIGQLKVLLDTQETKITKLEILVTTLRSDKAQIEKKIQDVSRILKKTLNS